MCKNVNDISQIVVESLTDYIKISANENDNSACDSKKRCIYNGYKSGGFYAAIYVKSRESKNSPCFVSGIGCYARKNSVLFSIVLVR